MKVLALLLLAATTACALGETSDDTELSSDTASFDIGVGEDGTAQISCNPPLNCFNAPPELVCGSDDITYASKCAFVTAFCATPSDQELLFIRSLGPCASDNKAPRAVEQPISLEGSDVQDADDTYCSLMCRMKGDPVCGSDGITYINDCHLLASKCELPTLEKVSHGKCESQSPDSDSDKNANDPVLQFLEIEMDVTDAPSEDEQVPVEPPTTVVVKCNPMCERVYDAVCGSDGITYANPCLLEYASCQNPNVKLFGVGKCPPNMRAARDDSVNANNPNGASTCVPGPCAYTYAPVCGSDGRTHDNLCLFANARCEDPTRALTVVHDGECDADTKLTCDNLTCPAFTECHEQKQRDGSVVAYCADVCSPDRCGEREDCELLDSDCFTAPCSPVATCVPKVKEQ